MLGIFLDIETTGLDPLKHSPIDIAFKVVDLASGEVKAVYQSLIALSAEEWGRSDPVSIRINGYTFEEVKQGAWKEAVKSEVIELLGSLGVERGKACFICQNPSFDRSFFAKVVDVYTQESLNWPYHWLDLASMYWAELCRKCYSQNLPLPKIVNLSKNAIAKEYHLPPEVEPHRAINGVDHLLVCYQAVLQAPAFL